MWSFFQTNFFIKKTFLLPTVPFSPFFMKANLWHIHIHFLIFSFQSSAQNILLLLQTHFASGSASYLHSLKPWTTIFSNPFIPSSSHPASLYLPLFNQDISESITSENNKAGLETSNNLCTQAVPRGINFHSISHFVILLTW